MTKKLFVSLAAMALLLGMASSVAAAPPGSSVFVATLSGAGEVPARDTRARGVAIFMLSEDGTALSYRLIAANIDNPVAAHIHCGDADDVAPVGVGLFAGAAASGRFDGVLAEGTITSPLAANACGWATLDDVIGAILADRAYVNVHTSDGLPGTNTGPGDFAAGEIRGQIMEAGSSR